MEVAFTPLGVLVALTFIGLPFVVRSVQPVLEVRQSDLPATPTEGDAVTVQDVLYLIVEVRPDGHGFLKLMLHKGGGHEAPTHPDS